MKLDITHFKKDDLGNYIYRTSDNYEVKLTPSQFYEKFDDPAIPKRTSPTYTLTYSLRKPISSGNKNPELGDQVIWSVGGYASKAEAIADFNSKDFTL